MTYIKHASITGLAGRSETVSLEFNRHVNVLFGLNGAGKTSLLRIIASAFSNDPSSLLSVPFANATLTIHSDAYDKDYSYSIDHPPISPELRDQPLRIADMQHLASLTWAGGITTRAVTNTLFNPPPFIWNVKPQLPKPATTWHHLFLPTYRIMEGAARSRSDTTWKDEFLDVHSETILQQYWASAFGDIQARVRASQEQGLAEILTIVVSQQHDSSESVPGEVNWEIAYERMRSFLKRQNPRAAVPPKPTFGARFRSDPLLRRVVNKIDDVESAISRAMAPRTKMDELIQRLFTGPKKVVLGAATIEVIANDTTNIGIRSLSSGEKQILRILIETIRAETSTLMIDEPEMSMHVDWQRDLIQAMRELNPEAQLILATQSPEIMANIPDSQIFRI